MGRNNSSRNDISSSRCIGPDIFLSEKELKQEGMIVHLTLVLVLADGLIVFYGEPGLLILLIFSIGGPEQNAISTKLYEGLSFCG